MKKNPKTAKSSSPTPQVKELPLWLSDRNNGSALLRLYIQPGAKKSAIVGDYNGMLKVAISAPPVDGKANLQLIKFLAKILDKPKSALTLIAGESSRNKSVVVSGATIAELLQRLQKQQN